MQWPDGFSKLLLLYVLVISHANLMPVIDKALRVLLASGYR